MANMDIKHPIVRGSQTPTIYVMVTDSTNHVAKTGLTAASFSSAYYTIFGAAPVSITLSDLAALTTAYTSGGIKEVDATHQPGVYRLDIPKAAVAWGLGVHCTIVSLVGSGIDACNVMIPLTDDQSWYIQNVSDTVRHDS